MHSLTIILSQNDDPTCRPHRLILLVWCLSFHSVFHLSGPIPFEVHVCPKCLFAFRIDHSLYVLKVHQKKTR